MKKNGFTLLELLVVIAIIGILATISTVYISSLRMKTRQTVVATELGQLVRAITIAEQESEQVFRDVTGSYWSSVHCMDTDLRGIAETSNCWSELSEALAAIEFKSKNIVKGINPPRRDPWGSPYLIDENGNDGLETPSCEPDIIYSAGPDGKDSTTGSERNDNISVKIPPLHCP